MKIFIAEFPGVWLGGYMVVLAVDESDAKAKAVKFLNDEGYTSNRLDIRELNPDENDVWMIFDGNY